MAAARGGVRYRVARLRQPGALGVCGGRLRRGGRGGDGRSP